MHSQLPSADGNRRCQTLFILALHQGLYHSANQPFGPDGNETVAKINCLAANYSSEKKILNVAYN